MPGQREAAGAAAAVHCPRVLLLLLLLVLCSHSLAAASGKQAGASGRAFAKRASFATPSIRIHQPGMVQTVHAAALKHETQRRLV